MIPKKFFIFFSTLVLAWIAGLVFFREGPEFTRSERDLVIMSYSSFLQPWGPGPWIQQEFKKKYGINIKWIDAGNAGLMLERLRFKFNIERPDLVLGFDQLALIEARKIISWKSLNVQELLQKKIEDLPAESIFYDFIPFDWSPMTFVTKKNNNFNPKNLSDFLAPEYKKTLALQDPQGSAPGLQFLFWILSVYGDPEGFSFLEKLKPSIHSISPSWSVSYSLFKEGQASMVFSYISSPLFHKIEENDDTYRALILEDPMPIQIEYVGIPHLCMNCEAARQFVSFLISKSSQNMIMRKNYMWPVVDQVREGTEFEPTSELKLLDSFSYMNWSKDKKKYISEWKKLAL